MKNPVHKFVAMLGMVAFVSTASCASAQIIQAYTTSGTETDEGAYGLSGYEFTVNQNINLTALGFTALSLGGGDAPHVTLWNANAGVGSLSQIYDTGNIITSVNSTPANTPPGGAPSFVSVGTPIELTVGNTYLITAPAYWVATFNSSGITNGSAIGTSTFLTNGLGQWNGWPNTGYTFSTLTAAPAGITPTTPNFEYTVVVVPEPATYAMFGLGFLVLVVAMRKRATSLVIA